MPRAGHAVGTAILAVLAAGALSAAGVPAVLVRGQVTDLAGRPVAKARIETAAAASPENAAGILTDEKGLFRLETADGTEIRVTKDGFLDATVPVRRDVPDVRVSLVPAAVLEVRVARPEDRPVEGAEVFLLPGAEEAPPESKPLDRQETDARGAAAFPPRQAGIYRLRVEADGFRTERRRSFSLEAGRHLQTVRLEPALTVTGRVLDERDRPVAGTRVGYLYLPFGPGGVLPDPGVLKGSVVAGEDGRYRIVLSESGSAGGPRSAILVALAARGAAAFADLSEALDARSLVRDLHLEPGGRISGRVVDERGLPAAGVQLLARFSKSWKDPSSGKDFGIPGMAGVDLYPLLSGRDPSSPLATGEHGEFRLDGVPAGVVLLGPWRPGLPLGAPRWKRVEVAPGEAISDLEIVLEEGKVLQGTVEGPAGDPIAGAKVRSHAGHETDTDETGAFRLAGFAGDVVPRLWIRADGYGEKVLRGVEISPEPLRVRLRLAGAVTGTVHDAPTGDPLAAFALRLVPHRSGVEVLGSEREEAFSDPEGTFRIADVTPGTYEVEAFSMGHLPATLERMEVREGEERPLPDLRLERGRTVRGRVLDIADGRPIAGVLVLVQGRRGGSSSPGAPRVLGRGLRDETDEEGRFEIGGIGAREVTLLLTHPEYAFRESSVAFEDKETVRDLDVTLSRGGTVRVTLLDAAGSPWPGQRIGIYAAENLRFEPGIGVRKTDESGIALFERVPPGPYEAAKVGSALRRPVEVSEGKDCDLTLRLEGTVLSGALTFRGRPVEDARVEVIVLSPQLVMNVERPCVEGGRYETSPLPPGKYGLAAHASVADPGNAGQPPISLQSWRTVEVAEGTDRVERDIAFQAHGVSGTVIRSGSGEPVPRASVVLELAAPAEGPFPLPFGRREGTRTSDDGTFRIYLSRPGPYRFRVRGESLNGWHLQGEDSVTVPEEGEVTGRVLVLAPGSGIRGVVRDGDGRPVEGAQVDFYSSKRLAEEGKLPFGGVRQPRLGDAGLYSNGTVSYPHSTDIEGKFRLTGQETGDGVLFVAHPSYAPAWAPATLHEERETTVDIAVSPGGTLEIIPPTGWGESSPASLLLARQGLPAPIRIDSSRIVDPYGNSHDPYVYRALSGEVILPRLSPGTWTVETAGTTPARRAVVEVREGETARADLSGGS